MGFTVSALTDYVNEQSDELLTAVQFEGETAQLATIHTGVKSAKALQILTANSVPQDGASCGFNASGDAAFTQAVITTKPIKHQDSFCPRALEAKWTQLLLKGGQNYSEADIPKKIIDEIKKNIVKRNETADWQGDTSSLSAYLNRYDGLIKLIKAATGTNVATAVSGPVTTSNVRSIMQNVIAKIPVQLKGNASVKVFCGYDIAELYRQKMFIDNLYHFPAEGNQKGIMVEGSVHELVPVHGLDGLGGSSGDNPFIFAFDADRVIHLGVDMEGEEEQAKMWVDGSDGETVKYSFRFRRGWQIVFPEEIVEYANT